MENRAGPEQLFEENQGLAYDIAWRYLRTSPSRIHDDIKSEALLGLWKACREFDPERGVAFSTFAVPCIRNQILMFFRRMKRQEGHVLGSLQDVMTDDGKGVPITFEDQMGCSADFDSHLTLQELAPLVRREPCLRLKLGGRTQQRIARSMGISQSSVARKLKKARARVVAGYEGGVGAVRGG